MQYAILNVAFDSKGGFVIMNWEQYRKLLQEKVDDARKNKEFYEKKLKESQVILDIAMRGQEAFEQALESKLEELGK